MLFIFDLMAGLFGSIGQDHSLDTKKIDNHINELRRYQWFNELYEDETYHRLFFVNRRVRKMLQSRIHVRRLINNVHAQNSFRTYLEKQLHLIDDNSKNRG
jgi:hypothetical protein